MFSIFPTIKRNIFVQEIEVENPCLCYDCFSTLHLFHKFKRCCLRTEEDLRLYVRERPGVKVVDLFDVLIESGEEIEDVMEPSTEAMEVVPSPPPNEVTTQTEITGGKTVIL